MSRSRRKRPFTGIALAESDKKDKQMCSRIHRQRNRQILKQDPEAEVFLDRRKALNVYKFSKDGKQRFDPERHPELMRK